LADRGARYQRRQSARERRQQESRRTRRGNRRRRIFMAVGGIAVVALAIGGLVLFMSTRSTFGKELPPTGFTAAHLETLPTRQINSQPIPRLVQEHVMERDSGHEKGSMLVQYNCVKYDCEPYLVDRLKEIVLDFPEYAWLAPYPTMDAKIALAAPGRLLLLDALEESKIRKFINDTSDR
jgi:hypothetical protein